MKRSAFTLVECIGSLLVTSLVVVLTGYALTAVRTTSRPSLDRATDWIICLQELESPDHRFALKRAERYQLELCDLNYACGIVCISARLMVAICQSLVILGANRVPLSG